MTQANYSVVTNYGRQWNARAAAGQDVSPITAMVFGDGDRAPTGGETELFNEVYRQTLSAQGVYEDQSAAFFDAYLEASVGGFVIREHGLVTEDGNLVAIGVRNPGIPKADPETGAADDFTYRVDLFFAQLDALVVRVDPIHGVTAERKITAGTGLTGGGNLAQDQSVAVDFATKSEAEAGSSVTKVMSPKRVLEAIISKLGLSSVSDVYHANKPNLFFRMGTGTDDNFDGQTYDDATNTIVAKADASKHGTDTGKSRYMASRIHATSTRDVTEDGDLHAFEIGDFAGGNGLKADPNEIMSRWGGKQKSIFWQNVLQTGDVKHDYQLYQSGENAWLVAPNFAGDTNVTLSEVSVYRKIIHDVAFFSLELEIEGFDIPFVSDASISFGFDVGAFGISRSFDRPLLNDSIYGQSLASFSGPGGDFPYVPFLAKASAGSNLLFFENRDRLNFNGSNNVTGLTIRASFMARVSD